MKTRHPIPLVRAAGALLLLVAVAACGSSASPAPASPAPASDAPAVTGAPASGAGELTPPPGGTTEVVVRAVNIEFEPTEVAAPANTPLTLVLDNKDEGIPHDIAITIAGRQVKTEIVTGPTRVSVAIGPLEPGSYPFLCEVHPNMTGTLVVGG